MKIIYLIPIFLTLSCANLEERSKKRDLQSKILDLISSQNKRYAACAKDNKIFKDVNADRIKVDMQISINSDGQVNKFQILDNQFSDKFSDCMFQVTDLIDFPSLEENEVIQLTQPFVFKK
jgi:hypothetical protein